MKYLKEAAHVSVHTQVESEGAFADIDETSAGTRRSGHIAVTKHSRLHNWTWVLSPHLEALGSIKAQNHMHDLFGFSGASSPGTR